jgi:hypothetical protein
MFWLLVILQFLVILVGLCVLVWYRNRSRKATTIGIVALGGYGLFMLLPYGPIAAALLGLEPGSGTILFTASILGSTLCPLLLVVAIVTDRRA